MYFAFFIKIIIDFLQKKLIIRQKTEIITIYVVIIIITVLISIDYSI
mgnify:FL=1